MNTSLFSTQRASTAELSPAIRYLGTENNIPVEPKDPTMVIGFFVLCSNGGFTLIDEDGDPTGMHGYVVPQIEGLDEAREHITDNNKLYVGPGLFQVSKLSAKNISHKESYLD